MTTPKRIIIPLAIALLAAFSWAQETDANAGRKTKLDKAFKGTILISSDALPTPDAEDPAGTIKTYKSLHKTVIEGDVVDGVATWNFHFTAFVKSKPKTSSLTLEFYTDDKEKLFVADKRLEGAAPNLSILTSTVSISEDENLNRNRKYVLKLVARRGKKSVTLATTKLATK
ncbi:MAG: hypothetical protein GY811_25250 [Myxococcales bacterium]|nr:hypothetical protein [Myxococcales bacterium]